MSNIKVGICGCNRNYIPPVIYKTIILKPNHCCNKNVLTQDMLNEENVKYVIKYNFNIDGERITVPENCILEFDGGSLKNGTIIGQDTVFINVGDVDIWGDNLTREGTWKEHSGGSGGSGIPDKEYDPTHYSGLGRKTLELKGSSNILTQEDFDQYHTIYVILYDFDLNGEEIEIPIDSILEFEGGSFDNGTIIGNNTDITANDSDVIFKKDITISGTWNVSEIFDTWFAYTENMVSNNLIKNVLALTDDDIPNIVRFVRDTTYHVEFVPTEISSQECPYYTADGTKDSQGNLIWTQAGTTKSIMRYVGTYKYPNNRSVYQSLGGRYAGILGDPTVLDDITLFKIKNNTEVIIDNTIQMLNHKFCEYVMFNLVSKQNIILRGKGKVLGEITDNYDITYKYPFGSQDYAPYDMYYGETGLLVYLAGAKNVTIEDLHFEGAAGNAISMEVNLIPCITGNAPEITKDITIRNVYIHNIRRNGSSGNGHNITIEGVTFSNCGIDSIGGTAPTCGIDFECDALNQIIATGEYPGTYLRDIVTQYMDIQDLGNKNVHMSDCNFIGNKYDISSTHNQYYDPSYDKNVIQTIISNCVFKSPLRLNGTHLIRFNNCYIESISSYDGTTESVSGSRGLEFYDCTFGDHMSPRYFSYTDKPDNNNVPNITLVGCKGKNMYTGENYVMNGPYGDSVVEFKIPFDYDERLDEGGSKQSEGYGVPYKLHRGIMHIRIVHVGIDLSMRVTECDLIMKELPYITNMQFYAGDINSKQETATNYASICSQPKLITDSVNHKRYILFYVAGGDVLNRFYDYATHSYIPLEEGETRPRPYKEKDTVTYFNYLGVPDNRGNLIKSVRTGKTLQSLEGGFYAGGIEVRTTRKTDISLINGYIFNWFDWYHHIENTSAINLPFSRKWEPKVFAPQDSSNEYIDTFPKIVVGTNNGIIPVGEVGLVDNGRDVYGGLVAAEGKLTYKTMASSRFGYALRHQGNVSVKLNANDVALQKAMSKDELADKVLKKNNIKFETGQQVFITDEGENGKLCSLLYDKTKITIWAFLNYSDPDVVINTDDTLQLYFFGKLIQIDVHTGDTCIEVITALRQQLITQFALETVDDITAPLTPVPSTDPGYPAYIQKKYVGRIWIKNDSQSSSVIYMKYANDDNVYNYSGGIYVIHSVNDIKLNVSVRLDSGEDFKVVEADGTLVTKFWT